MPHFEWPWALGALLLLPLVAWRRRRMRPSTLVFNRTAILPLSARQKFLRLPAALRLAALTLLIVAVARPQLGAQAVRDISKSIGIQVLIDRSGSMRHTDFQYGRGAYGREAATRLDVVKALSLQFIFGNRRDLKGRASDMIGLIEFAGDPITLSPLTLSHDHLYSLIQNIQAASGDEDGTAIGDAVALAAARFKEAEAMAGAQLKSKAIVLLTDGQNNMGARTPAQAAALAKQWGVRVYAIGIEPSAADNRYDQMIETGLDELGEETGGLSRMVESGAALVDVYKEIDRLEPSEVKAARYTGGTSWFGGLALAALCLVGAEAVISQTWLRRTP